ncbi:MAG: HAD-IIB family hydrolase [Pseudomonadota bacterium]
MHVMHVALGGCLTAPPVPYGLTEDTGGHIAYILGACEGQAARDDIDRIDIVTRAFDDPDLGPDHARAIQPVDDVTTIRRLRTGTTAYLAKAELDAELPALTEALLTLLRRGPRPDVLHAHFADAAELCLAAKARFGIPVIYTPHSLGIDKLSCMGGDPVLARRIAREREVIAGADAIVVSSRNEAECQVEAYGAGATGRIHRINPGVTLPPAPQGTDRARAITAGLADPDRPLVLAIARPVAKKNLPALLDAYATTPGLRDAANLCILAGHHDGPDSQRGEQCAQIDALRDGIERHGLRDRVVLPARHTGADVAQLYRHAAMTGGVFVNPALHEPFGLTLIEAAAAGLPVVATCRGGPTDIVDQIGHGECVDPRDGTALGQAILRTVFDRDLWRSRAKAARTNLAPYGWYRYARRTADLYGRLARARRTAPAIRATARRLLVCDIDNTLTGSRPAASRFRHWAQTRAIPFAVATGRSMTEARRVLADWDLPEPDLFITSVGTEIYLPDRQGRAVADGTYPDVIAPGWDAEAVTETLAGIGAKPQDPVEQRRFKRSYFGDQAEALRLLRALRDADLAASVVCSHQNLIDVLPARAGKAAAIEHAAALLGLTLDDCIACGDSGNDVSMLRAAGAAIVVGNALPEIATLPRRDGLIRTDAHHADGVLEGLARLGLGQRTQTAWRARP